MVMSNYSTFSIIFTLFMAMRWSEPVGGARNKSPPSWAASLAGRLNYTVGPNPFPFVNNGACKEWVQHYNYSCEEHKVTTKDGFILGVSRIPTRLTSNLGDGPTTKQPVLLQHGVLVDGISFMFIGRESLAFYLADQGFDVWVTNSRGTIYSLNHKELNPFQEKFWDWSVDEMIEYDFSAVVDYVHNQTGQKVHFVGHSMGTLIGLNALASGLPAVKKLRSATMLTPICYLSHITPFAVIAADLFLAEQGRFIGLPLFDPIGRPAAELSKIVCSTPGVNCAPFAMGFTGPNCCLNQTGIISYLSHETQPTSMKVMVHLSQNVRGGGNRKFNYGEKENKKHYGSTTAPKYDMTKIPKDFPIMMAYGGMDYLSDFIDVVTLLIEMKDHNQKKLIKNFHLDYGHGDFIMATNVVERVYEPMVKFMRSN